MLAFSFGGSSRTLAAPNRAPWVSNKVVGSPYPPVPYTVERIFPNVQLENPLDLAFVPGSKLLVIATQNGRFYTLDSAKTNAAPELGFWLKDFRQTTDSVLGFTFHPGFATNQFIFVNYNEPGTRENGAVVSRFKVTSLSPLKIDPSSEKILIRWLSGGHNGCTLAFGNDGFLYISTGDAASPDPPDAPYKTGQDISDLLSSILRIDVDREHGAIPYSIPVDNPFVNHKNARPEVWAFGFRNPFRMSFDRKTGDLWAGDVGWEQWEMVYRIERGGNYGWALTEGPNTSVRRDVAQGPGPILPPLAAISHTDGASVTGGVVYHGTRLPRLSGAYIYGDWETGRFWALRHRNGVLVSNDELCDTTLKPSAFTTDGADELLILDYAGGLYRFAPNAGARANATFPRKLSSTGLFSAMNPLTPAAGTIPYHPAAPMWNDHAVAEWLLGLPGTNVIATAGGVGNIAGGTWHFPANTVLARTLSLDMEAGKPASRRRVETQLLHWDGQAWNPHTFKWNRDQTDAALVDPQGSSEVLMVKDPAAPGGERHTPWRFMSRSECLRCHNAWAGDAMTLSFLQLDSTGERKRLVELGALSVHKEPGANSDSLVHPTDASAPIDRRARSWLHSNCAGCHRFGGGGMAALHLNYDKPLKELRTVDEKPLRGDFGIVDARIVAPGDPWRSTLLYRIATESWGRMPHIGSRLVDEAGMKLIREWIASLPPATISAKKSDSEVAPLLAQLAGPQKTSSIAKLLASTEGSLALATTVADSATRLEMAKAAATSPNNMGRELFQRFLPPDQRRKTLGNDVDTRQVLALKGNAERGRELFSGGAQCFRCHAEQAPQKAFGPPIPMLAVNYDRGQLLEQIIAPSKIIAPEFRTTYVTLRDDTELSGFIVSRTTTEFALRDETLAEKVVKLAEVKESTASALSAMPEGLLAPLTAQEAADLLDYLLSVAVKPGTQRKPK